MSNFVFSIVKAERIPGYMFPSVVAMKKLCWITIQSTQALILIFNRMGMNDIHDDCNSMSVCLVDEFLQLFRSAKPGAGCKEI